MNRLSQLYSRMDMNRPLASFGKTGSQLFGRNGSVFENKMCVIRLLSGFVAGMLIAPPQQQNSLFRLCAASLATLVLAVGPELARTVRNMRSINRYRREQKAVEQALAAPDIDKKMPILVVDDYSVMRKLIGGFLRKNGFEHILEARDGNDALRVIEEAKLAGNPVGLVITDIKMEHETGSNFVERLRTAKINTPAIIMTRQDYSPDAVPKRTGLLSKPFHGDDLVHAIGAATGLHAPAVR